MTDEVLEAPPADVAPSPDESLPPIAWIPAYVPATSDVPEALAGLIDVCVRGSLSALVARPAALDDIDADDWAERTRGSPVVVAKPLHRTDTGEMGQDWIVLVQTRGAGVGTVRRVATELGHYVRGPTDAS